ncbi:MAG: FAD binding domain-containing protein [Oscillibacter sp.]|nr:FAD binding domain-containing protein [Oscillibacter sp.]
MLPKFDLYMPTDLAEACRLKGEGAKVVAGGTDVFVNMHGGKDRSDKVVDVKNIPQLQGHSFSPENGLDLGALTTHRDIELWDVIKKHYRAMFEGCSRVGSVQIRTRGTLGGNICNGAPSADSIGPMMVHDAAVVVAGPANERIVPLKDFYLGLKQLDMKEDEILKRILIPAPKAHSGSFYIKYTRRNAMDLALLGVSAYVELDGDILKTVRIALTTAAPTPIRAEKTEALLIGKPASEALLTAAGKTVLTESHPRSSWRSSAEFRLALLEELTVQALQEAIAQAKEA